MLLLLLSMTVITAHALFFGGGGGCGCRPQQCSCAPPVQNFCPPSPCGRSFPTYPSYAPMAYRPPPPPPIPQNYYSVPLPVPLPQSHPIPIHTTFQNSYQQPILTSYNAPPYSLPPNAYNRHNFQNFQTLQNTPVQVTAAKETTSDTSDIFGDTVIQKSKTLSSVKNDLDEDVSALSNFETSLQAYKQMGSNGIRRAQGTKIEKPEKCSSAKLREIMKRAMSSNVSISKLKISQGAKKVFGYNFDVICSQFDFSYLISSNIFCRVELDGQTCLAYEN